MRNEYVAPIPEVHIQEPIIFGELIQLNMIRDIPELYISPHLAWQYSRRISNPIMTIPSLYDVERGVLPPSGFEPYYVGSEMSYPEVVEEISNLGDQYLRMIDPYNSGLRGRLLSILRHGNIAWHGQQAIDDLHLLKEADLIMGSMTNQLRTRMALNKDAQDYRDETYKLIAPFTLTLSHEQSNGSIIESYKLPLVERPSENKVLSRTDFNNIGLLQGWDFVSLLSRVANPIIHQALSSF